MNGDPLSGFRGRILGPRIEVLESIDSTNSELLRRIDAGEGRPGSLILARHQTRGRGRRGHSWADRAGLSLACSACLDLPGGVPASASTMVGAVALFELASERGVDARIKWPNDLLVGRRKLAGVLAETRPRAAGPALVVLGMGLNVGHGPADFPGDLDGSATSLRMEGASLTVDEAAVALATHLDRCLVLLQDPLTRGSVAERFGEATGLLGRQVMLPSTAGPLRGRLESIGLDGALHLRTERGDEIVEGAHVASLQPA